MADTLVDTSTQRCAATTAKTHDCRVVQEAAIHRVRDIFRALSIDFAESDGYLRAACPIHQGENDRGMYWVFRTGHWKCLTQHCECEQITGPSSSIFGLVRGTLSIRTGKDMSFNDAIETVAGILGLSDVVLPEFSSVVDLTPRRRKVSTKLLPVLRDVLKFLRRDDVYYPFRGVPAEIIRKYHISYCDNPAKPMYNRAFFPVLDENGEYVMGWSGRIVFEQCQQCKHYHHPQDGCDNCWTTKAKWFHSSNFKSSNTLYNLWHAKPFISSSRVAILCEGPGDCWGCEVAGVKNSVGILGSTITKPQMNLLQKSGAIHVVVCLDGDSAGRKGTEGIVKKLDQLFNVRTVELPDEADIGSMTSENVRNLLVPVLQSFGERGTKALTEIAR